MVPARLSDLFKVTQLQREQLGLRVLPFPTQPHWDPGLSTPSQGCPPSESLITTRFMVPLPGSPGDIINLFLPWRPAQTPSHSPATSASSKAIDSQLVSGAKG